MQSYHWARRLGWYPAACMHTYRHTSSPRNYVKPLYLEQKQTQEGRGDPSWQAAQPTPPPRAPLSTYPTFGSPTIPIFRDVPNLPMIGCDLTPSPPFFGGIWKHRTSHAAGPARGSGPAAHPPARLLPAQRGGQARASGSRGPMKNTRPALLDGDAAGPRPRRPFPAPARRSSVKAGRGESGLGQAGLTSAEPPGPGCAAPAWEEEAREAPRTRTRRRKRRGRGRPLVRSVTRGKVAAGGRAAGPLGAAGAVRAALPLLFRPPPPALAPPGPLPGRRTERERAADRRGGRAVQPWAVRGFSRNGVRESPVACCRGSQALRRGQRGGRKGRSECQAQGRLPPVRRPPHRRQKRSGAPCCGSVQRDPPGWAGGGERGLQVGREKNYLCTGVLFIL